MLFLSFIAEKAAFYEKCKIDIFSCQNSASLRSELEKCFFCNFTDDHWISLKLDPLLCGTYLPDSKNAELMDKLFEMLETAAEAQKRLEGEKESDNRCCDDRNEAAATIF